MTEPPFDLDRMRRRARLITLCERVLGFLFAPVALVLVVIGILLFPAFLAFFVGCDLVRALLGWKRDEHEELTEGERRLIESRRRQKQVLPELHDQLAALVRILEGHESRDGVRQAELAGWLYRHYLAFSRRDPDELLEEIKAWLHEYEETQRRHPDVLKLPDPRLAAIGDYTVDTAQGIYRWKEPQSLAGGFTPFDLVFQIECDAIEPDERMFELWERYQAKHPILVEEYKRRILEDYRGWFGDDLPSFSSRTKLRSPVSDDEVLQMVEGGTVAIICYHDQHERWYSTDVTFDLEWEQEHLYGFVLDDEGTVVDTLG